MNSSISSTGVHTMQTLVKQHYRYEVSPLLQRLHRLEQNQYQDRQKINTLLRENQAFGREFQGIKAFRRHIEEAAVKSAVHESAIQALLQISGAKLFGPRIPNPRRIRMIEAGRKALIHSPDKLEPKLQALLAHPELLDVLKNNSVRSTMRRL